jgi:1-acyl-sn-glycerol-3-phosphate acyltransferase
MTKILRFLFFTLIVRTVVLFVLGLNVRHRERLPTRGPAILVANHNSHLDTLVLMTLLTPKLLPRVQPVAAADYFLRNKLLAWFALNIIGILPIKRKRESKADDPLAPIVAALRQGQILIFFPEGSRGKAEQLTQFKTGIARLAEHCPDVPVIPVYLHGLGKALPKGASMLVPFFCDVFVGKPLTWNGDRSGYMNLLSDTMHELADAGQFPTWE